MLITKQIFEKDVDLVTLDISRFSSYRQKKINACRNKRSRICSICASLALESALSELGILESETEYTENEFGKPFFKNIPSLYFSLSHTDGLSVCAVSDTPVGTDCERADRQISPAVLKRFFTESEISAYPHSPISLWTLKEAYTKMRGLPFTEGARELEISFSEDKTEFSGVYFERKVLDGFIISVANKII